VSTDRTVYAIRVDGHLDDHWSTWVDALELTRGADGTTTLTVAVADQAQLHGVLASLRDLGAVLTGLRIVTATLGRRMAAVRAPQFSLPSVGAGEVTLASLTAAGPALVVFVAEECPTSRLALRRLAAVAEGLAGDGIALAVVFEDPLAVAARTARTAGLEATLVSEPPPYATSRAYELVSVPTAVLVDRDGGEAGRVVGWDVEAWDALLAVAAAQAGVAPRRFPVDEPRQKPGCGAKSTYDEATMRLDAAAGSAAEEIEDLFGLGWTDGLPVVPPTRDRVAAMLGGRAPGATLGPVPPGMGEATLERVAACAVLAGCRPAYFPVVLAACEAALEEGFNLNGQAVTTSPPGQLIVVNGPVREAVGLNAGMGALGPGWRANLTIGRALRLLVELTGGGMPGGLDRATLGHAGKVGACIAEAEEVSPWEPLSVERGFAPGTSTVTLIAADSPLSISDHRSTTPEQLASCLGWAAASQWSTNWWPLAATSLFVVCPEHARLFADAGWRKADVRTAIYEAVQRPARELRGFGEVPPETMAADPDTPIHKWSRPEDLLLIVAGGEAGRFSAVYGPSLGMGAEVISREVAA
jgi:hypothetical protein